MHNLSVDAASNTRRWAAQACSEMEDAGVVPTPLNFELWFTHVSGANLELSRQIALSLSKQSKVGPAALEALRASLNDLRVDTDEVLDRADGIQQAAQTMVDEVAGHGKQLQEYGSALSYWTREIRQHRTVDHLSQAIATLTAETARASERNRILERRLSASSARVTRLKDSMANLQRAATTDILTGLFNRKAFDIRLRRILSEAKEEGSPVSVLMLDVDHFRRINDKFGHKTGDLVLRLIGRLLSDSVKGHNIAARYGGEEFAVLLAGTDLKGGFTLANQIRQALETKHLVKRRATDEFGMITVSIGVAQSQPTDTAASLLNRADTSMYRAKHLGRNQVCSQENSSTHNDEPPDAQSLRHNAN